MATAKKRVFTPAQLAYARKDLIQQRLGLFPVDVQSDGFYYDGPEALLAIKKKLPVKKTRIKKK